MERLKTSATACHWLLCERPGSEQTVLIHAGCAVSDYQEKKIIFFFFCVMLSKSKSAKLIGEWSILVRTSKYGPHKEPIRML